MQVGAIMSSPPVTVDIDATLHDAIGTMLTHRVGSVIVIDAGLAGILTRSDVLRAAYHYEGSLSELPVTDGMSRDVVTTFPSQSVPFALEAMKDNNIKKLPVIEDFDVVGIVTMTDIAIHQPARVQELQKSFNRKDEWTD